MPVKDKGKKEQAWTGMLMDRLLCGSDFCQKRKEGRRIRQEEPWWAMQLWASSTNPGELGKMIAHRGVLMWPDLVSLCSTTIVLNYHVRPVLGMHGLRFKQK